MKKSNLIISATVLFCLLAGCKSADLVKEIADTSAVATTEVTEPVEDDEPTTAIEARTIMLDGELYYIESISPIDYVIYRDGTYISLFGGEASEYSEALSEENLLGEITLIENAPERDLESNFYLNAEVYSDRETKILLARNYENEEAFVFAHSVISADSYSADDIRYVFSVYDKVESQ